MCNGPTHRAAGVACWLAAAPVLPVTPWQVAVGAVIAGATANGRLSPDMDQSYYVTGKLFSGHRHETHLWLWPVLAFGAGLAMGQPYGWVVLAVSIAWGSHDIWDAPFGGVPLWFGRRQGRRRVWHRRGLHFKTGGLVERFAALPLALLAGVLLAGWDAWSAASAYLA